ncbi:MAG: ABC transporter ATP-binding protein [Deltaproteobacteria bacterium]|nr:ABC transporter ATP-binding protein [Deltaproteobacteria bacterium]
MSSDAKSEISIPDEDATISAKGLGKAYRIYDRPQDRLKQAFLPGKRKTGREFWALRDISFEMHRGESVGIIGQNGSGKSTLLQIITGTLKPSAGEVRIRGKVAALLELGAGFNPEYTGRENVFMNGSILGLTGTEIESRFDRIAAFADIGEFIDQKVKIYSSGMFIRLAFAVATCVDPEILVVDEALSVGDTSFQHKCMRRIKQMVDRGASVLLVSHAMDTIQRFCQRALWLEGGENRFFGQAGAAVEKYVAFLWMKQTEDAPENGLDLTPERDGSKQEFDPADLPAHSQLPTITSLDITGPMLYRLGDWDLRPIEDNGPLALMTQDPGALVGFRFKGNRLKLRFMHHPWSRSVRILLDGRESLVDLYQPNRSVVKPLQFFLEDGLHTVYMLPGPAKKEDACQVWWLGGELGKSDGKMIFKRDPRLESIVSGVERFGNGKGSLTAVELLDYKTEEPVMEVFFGQKVRLRLHAERLRDAGPRMDFSFIVRDRNRVDLFGTSTFDEDVQCDPRARFFVAEFSFQVLLGPGSYSILATFCECSDDLEQKIQMDQIDIAYVFTVPFDPHRPVWYMFHQPIDVRVDPYPSSGV